MLSKFFRRLLCGGFVTICATGLVYFSGASTFLATIILIVAVICDMHVYFVKNDWARKTRYGNIMGVVVHPRFPIVLNIVFCSILFLVVFLGSGRSYSNSEVLVLHLNRFFSGVPNFLGGRNDAGISSFDIAAKTAMIWMVFFTFFSAIHARIVFHMDGQTAEINMPEANWNPKERVSSFVSIILTLVTVLSAMLYVFSVLFSGAVYILELVLFSLISSLFPVLTISLAKADFYLKGEQRND